ncbi:MAG: hypothetical protein WC107_04935 [Patescibacteria group bacterium]
MTNCCLILVVQQPNPNVIDKLRGLGLKMDVRPTYLVLRPNRDALSGEYNIPAIVDDATARIEATEGVFEGQAVVVASSSGKPMNYYREYTIRDGREKRACFSTPSGLVVVTASHEGKVIVEKSTVHREGCRAKIVSENIWEGFRNDPHGCPQRYRNAIKAVLRKIDKPQELQYGQKYVKYVKNTATSTPALTVPEIPYALRREVLLFLQAHRYPMSIKAIAVNVIATEEEVGEIVGDLIAARKMIIYSQPQGLFQFIPELGHLILAIMRSAPGINVSPSTLFHEIDPRYEYDLAMIEQEMRSMCQTGSIVRVPEYTNETYYCP